MESIRIFLFRRLTIRTITGNTIYIEGQKTQELLTYLLIHRHRPHTRDVLASLLWQNSSESKAKRYLRQSLWQLQSIMEREQGSDQSLIRVDGDWIQFNYSDDIWIDIDIFDQAYNVVKGVQGRDLDETKAAWLEEVVQLYRGDFLENWYQDWCLIERERLQNNYLAMLGKLIGYCESKRQYDFGKSYCQQILQCEKAHERTFRCLMRLYYYAGDRTKALRTFQRCERVLHDELGVSPSRRTLDLYEMIQAGQLPDSKLSFEERSTDLETRKGISTDHLNRLSEISHMLVQVQRQIENEIESFKV